MFWIVTYGMVVHSLTPTNNLANISSYKGMGHINSHIVDIPSKCILSLSYFQFTVVFTFTLLY